MKKLFLILGWWLLSLGAFFGAAVSLSMALITKNSPITILPTSHAVVADATAPALPVGEVQGVQTSLETGDARADILANFLKRHDSPLKPYDEYAQKIVAISDQNNLDFRLLVAIAMQESNLCKKIPEGSHNCLGFGIHSRGTLEFDSYDASFERAAREIKKNYVDQGLTTPEDIMQKYTPSSNGSWAASVNQWLAEMRYDDRAKGKELKSNANVTEFTQSTSYASK
jgi:hypothetical protein